jgi:glycosyltransferase involved in cell wall biosynthesis
MNVVVLATASRLAGALTIYKQFIAHLASEIGGDNYYLFIHPSMPQPKITKVEYILIDTSSFWSRLEFDIWGCKKEMRKRGIQADVILSLQNTGLFHAPAPQLIYYHQPLPLYPNNWNPLKRTERHMFLYKNIYPIFVKLTCNAKTQYIVQIPFIQEGLSRMMKINTSRIHVLFPDIERVEAEKINAYCWNDSYYHFVYPANMAKYKNYDVLVDAFYLIEDKDNYRLHFTINKDEYPELYKKIVKLGLKDVICLDGMMPHNRILSMYKSSTALLFPSTIETLGLPLLEAGALGLPIIAADLDYTHQVIGDYEGVHYVDANNAKAWAVAISELKSRPVRYTPIKYKTSTWPLLFDLVRNIGENSMN